MYNTIKKLLKLFWCNWFRCLMGILILIISIIASIVSTLLTISYFNSIALTTGIAVQGVVGFIILMQAMVLLGACVKGIVSKICPQHYNTIRGFTLICFVLSVLSTISFFNQFDKTERANVISDLLNVIPFVELHSNNWLIGNLTNMTLIWISCIIIDLMAMMFPSIGVDLLFKIATRQKIVKTDLSFMDKVIAIIKYLPVKYIDNLCIKLGIMQVENEELQNNKPQPQVEKTQAKKITSENTQPQVEEKPQSHVKNEEPHVDNKQELINNKQDNNNKQQLSQVENNKQGESQVINNQSTSDMMEDLVIVDSTTTGNSQVDNNHKQNELENKPQPQIDENNKPHANNNKPQLNHRQNESNNKPINLNNHRQKNKTTGDNLLEIELWISKNVKDKKFNIAELKVKFELTDNKWRTRKNKLVKLGVLETSKNGCIFTGNNTKKAYDILYNKDKFKIVK